jgi:hypothetical protein
MDRWFAKKHIKRKKNNLKQLSDEAFNAGKKSLLLPSFAHYFKTMASGNHKLASVSDRSADVVDVVYVNM